VLVRTACADLISAETAYQKGDFVKAFQDSPKVTHRGLSNPQAAVSTKDTGGDAHVSHDIQALARSRSIPAPATFAN
jgi:hypothetical protein